MLLRIEIVAFARKGLVERDMNHNEEVSGRSAAESRLTRSGNAQGGSLTDTRRNLDGQGRRFLNGPGSAAGCAGRLDNAAFAAAGRASLSHDEKPALRADLTGPPAGLTGDR